jgi:hypothetical protein
MRKNLLGLGEISGNSTIAAPRLRKFAAGLRNITTRSMLHER